MLGWVYVGGRWRDGMMLKMAMMSMAWMRERLIGGGRWSERMTMKMMMLVVGK